MDFLYLEPIHRSSSPRPLRPSFPDDLHKTILPLIAPDTRAEEGYSNERKSTINSIAKQGEGSTKKFACPFFKHDPIKYGAKDRRRCDCSGWIDISRLKEHLSRSHAQKTYCNKCYEEFPSVDGLIKHTTFACTPRSGRPPDGITIEVLRKLRSRKKTSRPQSDYEKWVEIYRTLFPTRRHVPSPYFEEPQGKVLVPLEDHEEYIRKEFRRLVESRVEINEGWKDKGELKRVLDECLDEALIGYRKKSEPDFYDNADVCSSDQMSTTQISEPPLSTYNPQTDSCYAADGTVPQDGTMVDPLCGQCLLGSPDCKCSSLASSRPGRNVCLSAESFNMTDMSEIGSWTWETEDLHFNAEHEAL